MHIRYGNSVENDDYLPRKDIEQKIVDTLMLGDSASLFGLRRIGKSSTMKAIARRLRAHGRLVINMDVQSVGHLGNFFKEFLAALAGAGYGKEIGEALRSQRAIPEILLNFILPSLARGSAATPAPDQAQDLSAYSVAIGRIVGDRVGAMALERRPVLLIDEIVDLCDHALKAGATTAQIEALLSQLTYWRKCGMAMLITGSVGLRSWVRRHHVDSNLIRDLIPNDLPPLEPGEARAMIDALVRGAGLGWWDATLTDWLLTALPALYPSIIQFALHHLRYERPPTAPEERQAALQTFLQDRLLPEFESMFLGQFDERIKAYQPKVTAVRTLIRAVCGHGGPLSYADFKARLDKIDETNADDFQAMLRDDGFLIISPSQGVRAASPLVSLWAQV